MLRNPLLIPISIIIGAAIGFVFCRAFGLYVPKRDLAVAVVSTGISVGIGFLPTWFLRRSEPSTLANASVGGTLLHTMLSVGCAVVWWSMERSGNIDVFWKLMLPLYWCSLAALATVSISMVKALDKKVAAASRAPAPTSVPLPPRRGFVEI